MASRAAILLDPHAYSRRIEANGNDTESLSCPSLKEILVGRASSEPPAFCSLAASFDRLDPTRSDLSDQSHSLVKGTTHQNPGSFSGDHTSINSDKALSTVHQFLIPQARVSSPEAKSRLSVSSSPTMVRRSDVQSLVKASPISHNIEFEFLRTDLTYETENEESAKHPFAEVGSNAEGGHGSLIEDVYNVQSRSEQPQKRIKLAQDYEAEKAAQIKPTFNISGNSGLGEWMRKDKVTFDTLNDVSPVFVDLTSG
jgi:hypothetical protein